VTLLFGPAGAGKTSRLLERYRQALSASRPGDSLWLAPTARAASEINGLLLSESLRACFSPDISTFARFTAGILPHSPRPTQPLNNGLKRQLVRQLLEDERRAGRLEHFGPIASTAGLLDLVCEFIRQMKRLEIWPEHFAKACHDRGMGKKDAELLAIYQAYQEKLVTHNLYDAEGQFWSARDLLRQSPQRFELVVVDGFSDFTRTEHDMLQTLAEQSAETWISLPLEQETGREDLFQKALATRNELRRRHPELREVALQRTDSPEWPALAHIERKIFSNPRTMKSARDTAGIEILACGRQIGEIETIGRKIKRLLTEGNVGQAAKLPHDRQIGNPSQVHPGEIAVVFRHPQGQAGLVREVFARLGIPYYLEHEEPLVRSSPVVMLLQLLELDADDWPMHKLLCVIGNNYFLPADTDWNGPAAGRAEIAIRGMKIPRGRERLLERLAHANDEFTYPVLRRLASALDALPRLATLAEHGRAWDALADQTGIRRAMRGNDALHWDQLFSALAETQRLARWLSQDAPLLDRSQAREELLDIARSQSIRRSGEDFGGVRVLSAASARHVKTRYLFLAGLSEKSFPSADSDDGIYSHADRKSLIDAGLPLASRSDRQSEEMLLFYESIGAATQRLWLSYPSVDESGEPLTPSPYVAEVIAACGEAAIAREEQIDLSPVPMAADVCSPDAFRIRAAADVLEGKSELLAALARNDERAGKNLLRGLEFARLRQNRERFTACEGVLGESAVKVLADEFSPDRIFSATELENYAHCPYRFFLGSLLKVRPMDDLALEVDYAQRGQLAHALLAAFHRRVNAAAGKPASPATLSPDDFDRILAEAAADTLGPPCGDGLTDTLREIDRRKLRDWLVEYIKQHAKYDKLWAACDSPPLPQLFEVSFGRELRDGQTAPSTADPLELMSDSETVRLSGRIDRIDIGKVGNQVIFNIVDYKTGGSTKFDIAACRRGGAMQLPLYAMAAAELILNDRDGLPWQGGYWYLSDDGFKPRQALKMYELSEGQITLNETWETIRGFMADTVIALVKAIRRGEFPVFSDDDNCTGRCPYKTVCRVNQVRSLEKEWQP
jgi:ATP-dependent helicase/DNAse subunit B